MASKKTFQIPSADELDRLTSQKFEGPGSLFNAHKSSIRQRNENEGDLVPRKGQQLPRVCSEGTSSENTSSAHAITAAVKANSVSKCEVTAGEKLDDSKALVQKESTMQSEDVSKQSVPSKPGKGNALVVSNRQRGNPVLKHIRNVAWEFGDIVPDYQMGLTNCALFLSLRYHNLNPDYIHQRLKQLGHSYTLRILLVQVDVKDPHHALKELANICILSDCTLILAFTAEEAGRYLETYKAFENKPPDLIMEKTEGNYLARFTDVLTAARRVNKTDAATLISKFGTFEELVRASEEDLSLCPGFGPQKAQRVYSILREPFLKSKKRQIPQSRHKKSTTEEKKIKNS